MSISVTLLSSYQYCARKVFLERVLGIKLPVPPEAMIKGGIRHKVYEEINKSFESLVKGIKKRDFDSIFFCFKEKYTEILRNAVFKGKEMLREIGLTPIELFSETRSLITGEAYYRSKKVFDFMEKTGLIGDELWESLTPKVKPEYRIDDDGLGLKGIIDELEVHDGMLLPIELKTGKAPPEGVWDGHKIQVAAYAMLVESRFGIPVEKAVVRYLDTNQAREVMINPFLKDEVKELILRVNELLESGKLPEFPENSNKCTNCDMKTLCHDEKLMNEKTKHLNRN